MELEKLECYFEVVGKSYVLGVVRFFVKSKVALRV